MLKAKDLWKQADEQHLIKMNAMKPVLCNLFNQLKNHAARNPEAPYFVFDVPSYVFGYPLYDHQQAVKYVKETLEEQGFQVWISGVSTLVISWIKPTNKEKTTRFVLPQGPSYRPFVYDDSMMNFLRSKIE